MAVEALKKNGLGDDFLSLLVKANEEDKTALSDQELYDMIVLAIFGGIDTTRNQIALAMDMFVQHPDQWKRLVKILSWQGLLSKKSCACARP
jgi:cytochrome P450